MKECLSRSAPHMGLLRDGLSALGHAARRRSLALPVYAAEDAGVDCPSLMAAVMLQHRDNEVPLVPLRFQQICKLEHVRWHHVSSRMQQICWQGALHLEHRYYVE